jgi:hypothetical protein
MMQDVRMKLNPGLSWQSSFQEEEGSFYQHFGLKYKEETSEVLHLGYSCA